ncbi:MAG: flagellar filament capping protein FliD [Planctomycetota bacterium]
MGRITSNVGLASGLDIQSTVDQLMQLNAIPRDNLFNRTEALKSEQVAVTTLSARLATVQFDLGKLNSTSLYSSRQVVSSNESVLSLSVDSDATPPVGSFSVRTVQTASSQQLVSQRFDADDIDLGTGSFSFGVGGFVDEGASLDSIRSGEGFDRGQIRITDRSGESAVIDLSTARSVDDVLDAINLQTEINVTAAASGDAFVLTDGTGGSGNLTVQEVSGGTTAASLGLDAIDVAADQATGSDIFDLYSGTKLSELNDGNGVRIVEGTDDFTITVSDGTEIDVDLSGDKTLGDVIASIEAAVEEQGAGKLTAAIGTGDRLVLTDATTGSGELTVTSNVGSAAAELGLTGPASGNTLTGDALASGLKDTLLSSLNGGAGFDQLGAIDINGTQIDLSTAETLGDVVDLINASGVAAEASINAQRSGIAITATGGGTLSIQNAGDSTNTADSLGIATTAATAAVDSGALDRQTLSEATLLASLDGTDEFLLGDIRITDSSGAVGVFDLNTEGNEALTVGDVIDRINNDGSVGVTAAINSTGDGILLTDTAGGTGTLGVSDINGNVAERLNLTGASTTVDIEGTPTQVIDGTRRYTVDVTDLESSATSLALSSLKDGAGITLDGDIIITDSAGERLALDLNGSDSGIKTVGDFIDLINSKASQQGVGVTASIDETGTGIAITDTAGGDDDLTVADIGGSVAASLGIAGETEDGAIQSTGLFSAASAGQNALENLVDRVNELNAGVTASVIADNGGFRLALTVDEAGAGNELLLDLGGTALEFEELISAEDALIVYGESALPGSGLLLASETNTFEDVISGVTLTVNTVSDEAVEVNVTESDTDLISAANDFVESYNVLRSELDELTSFDEVDLTTGLLFGSGEALRVESVLGRILTDRYLGLGGIASLEQAGISLDADGKLSLDQSKFSEAFSENPDSLRSFFTDEAGGFVASFSEAIDQLAGAENSLLTNRSDSLQQTITSNEERIGTLDSQLERERERLTLEFIQLETIIASLQQDQNALESLQPIAPLSIQRRSQ